jgi:pyrroloquinoline quinone (PQQ) biosynthesis protein C
VIRDEDAQMALWMMYEFHYRGFDDVADAEWDPELIMVRRKLERCFEAELRQETQEMLAEEHAEDVGQALLDMADAARGPSVAAFLQRHATHEQFRDYLRERSVQQLKESDPQSFVLPRLDGAAKAALAELQYDEYGGGRPEHLHATLYRQAMTAAGLDPEYGAYIDQVGAVTLAAANAMSLFALNRRLRGAAMGHLAVFEATSSLPCRKIAAGVGRLGFPETVGRYFDEHVEADAVHEQLAARDICAVLVHEDPTLRQDVLFGGAACLHLDAVSGQTLLDRWTHELQEAS